MKSTLITCLSVLLCSCAEQAIKTTTIHVECSESVVSEDQWVYWVCLTGNEYQIDSCFVPKGKTSFQMKKRVENPGTSFVYTWLTFGKNGPVETYILPDYGSVIRVLIDEKTSLYPYTEGSPTTQAFYEEGLLIGSILERKKYYRDLAARYELPADSAKYKIAMDSLDYYTEYMEFGRRMDILARTTSPKQYSLTLNTLDYLALITTPEHDSLVNIMKQRFPASELISLYPNSTTPYPPSSEASKAIAKRSDEITDARMGWNSMDDDFGEKAAFDVLSIKPYQIDDLVPDFILNPNCEDQTSLKNIRSDYILLDFWASWCLPCRKETQPLLNTLRKFERRLAIVAISIDDNHDNWQQAVKIDKSEAMHHFMIGSTSEHAQRMMAQFGVQAIPANFLLDKDRRIIATDLRGSDLEEKMKSLTTQ